MNPLELVRFVESVLPEHERANALALLADAPGEDFLAKIPLPVQNELPAFRVGTNTLGSNLANLNYGVAAPVFGEEPATLDKSIGELLTGEIDGTG